MKTTSIALLLASSVILSACAAYVSPTETSARAVSTDYMASGMGNARAYIYGNRTIVEFDAEPAFLAIRDSSGAAVAFEKVGLYYRLGGRLDTFTVWANGKSVTFSANSMPRVLSAPIAASAVNPQPINVAAIEPASPPDADVEALIKLSEKQLNEVRDTIDAANKNNKATGAELYTPNARLQEIETRLMTDAAAIVRVSFPTGSTDFKPSTEVAQVLIASGKEAQSIKVHGYTDSRIAGPDDANMALGRALAARRFLLENGIESKKISVFSTAAGDFTAPNLTNEGRALNRRVEIEFVDARIAEHKE